MLFRRQAVSPWDNDEMLARLHAELYPPEGNVTDMTTIKSCAQQMCDVATVTCVNIE